ncbi:hypothetical protein BC940DRAFT_287773 [Gongronella butleri]|nr:hypothetical protein BC940DRAFT_287773 [Gongronella butleri]
MLGVRAPAAYRSLLNRSRVTHRLYSSEKPFPRPYPNRPIDQQETAASPTDEQNATSHENGDNVASIPPSSTSISPLSSSTSTEVPPVASLAGDENEPRVIPLVSAQADLLKSDTSSQFIRKHHFDTYRLLQTLENQGFSRLQAEVVMKGIKFKLRESTARLRKMLLLRSDLENDSYLFKAELSELRTEIQIMRRNDTQMLQTDAAMITREVEALGQRMREDVATMKNDVTLDMNNRKNETQEEQKAIDMRIQEINNKFTVQLGEVRTDLEAVRWETIWKGMAGIVAAGFTIATLGYLLTRFADRRAEAARIDKLKRKKLLKEEARQSGAADMEVIYTN